MEVKLNINAVYDNISTNGRVSLVEEVMLNIITNHDQKDRD